MRLYNVFSFILFLLHVETILADSKAVVFVDVPQGNRDAIPSLRNAYPEFTASGTNTLDSLFGTFAGIPPYEVSEHNVLPDHNLHTIYPNTAHFGEWPFKKQIPETEYFITKDPFKVRDQIIEFDKRNSDYLITVINPFLSPLYLPDDHYVYSKRWQTKKIECGSKKKVSNADCYLEPYRTLIRQKNSIQNELFRYLIARGVNILWFPVHGPLSERTDAWYNINSDMRGERGSNYFANILHPLRYSLVNANIRFTDTANAIDILPTVAALLEVSNTKNLIHADSVNLLESRPRANNLKWVTNFRPVGNCKSVSPKYAEQIIHNGKKYVFLYDKARSEIYEWRTHYQWTSVTVDFTPDKSFAASESIRGCDPLPETGITRKIPKRNKSTPSVLLIMGDDLNGIVDANREKYSTHAAKTPTIDKILSDSLQLRDFQTETTCTPSRTSLLTGQRATTLGIMGAYRHFAKEMHKILPAHPAAFTKWYFLSTFFKAIGYTTAMFGKAHWYDPALPFTLYDYQFDDSKCHSCNNPPDKMYPINKEPYVSNSSMMIADDSIEAIQKANGEPLFLYAAPHNMHSPFDISHDEMVKLGFNFDNYPSYSGLRTAKLPLRPHTKYTATYTLMDKAIGRIIDEFNKYYQDNWILVYIPGDNGREQVSMFKLALGDIQGRGGKRSNYDTDGTVFISWGNRIKGVSSLPATIADIFPTLVGLLGYDTNNLPTFYREDGRIFSGLGKQFDGLDLSKCLYAQKDCKAIYERIRYRQSVADSRVDPRDAQRCLESAPRFMLDYRENDGNAIKCYADSTSKGHISRHKFSRLECYNFIDDHLQTKNLVPGNTQLGSKAIMLFRNWPNFNGNRNNIPRTFPAHRGCASQTPVGKRKNKKRKRRKGL